VQKKPTATYTDSERLVVTKIKKKKLIQHCQNPKNQNDKEKKKVYSGMNKSSYGGFFKKKKPSQHKRGGNGFFY
jgi:hypothetical protein